MPVMMRAQIERLSIRTALAIGFAVTLGLWLYTGYTFTQRIDTVQRDAGEVASRYMRAQELLSTVRAQVLLISVRVRDGLLDPQPELLAQSREQLAAAHRIVLTYEHAAAPTVLIFDPATLEMVGRLEVTPTP